MGNKTFGNVDKDKMARLIEIKSEYLLKKITKEEARRLIMETYESITPEEFAYTEQVLKDEGFGDDALHDNMDNMLDLLEGILDKPSLDLAEGHPIRTYREENAAVVRVLAEADSLVEEDFNLDKWVEVYEKLNEFNTHLSRKQNQLFSKLEEKGFDRPSKIMWSFDNNVKKAIGDARKLLADGTSKEEFIPLHMSAKEQILDIIDKEESVLFPASLKMISDDEFKVMRIGDDEIGYCLVEDPKPYKNMNEESNSPKGDGFVDELYKLMQKHNMNVSSDVLDVKQGKLTLEQINLIFQHLPIDLSFVDEDNLVKFYSDTVHRVFPRSPGVIGRDVKNCHPRESVDTVMQIVDAFKSGRKDSAEFWLEMGDKFIYILYTAVRDAEGKFRGVLEMMQEVSHIRSLEGSQRLLSWGDEEIEEVSDIAIDSDLAKKYGVEKDTIIADLIKRYPYIREFLPTISPKYKKILNPVAFNSIGRVATLDMVAMRGNVELPVLISKLVEKIDEEEKK